MSRSEPDVLDIINFDPNELKDSPLRLCSYLPDRVSQLTFLLLQTNQSINPKLYTLLAHNGFRRSGNAFYRPKCFHCQQCIASRIKVSTFKPSRRYRRVLNRNTHVVASLLNTNDATQEHYQLYERYICQRHADGDMYPPSLHTFEQFLLQSPANTQMIEFREPSGKLVAVAMIDKISDGISSTYTFFDPSSMYSKRSLGVYCILKQIELVKSLGLEYVYLGYWIPTVKKMSYKVDYTPIELLINSEWIEFDETPDTNQILDLLHTYPVKSFDESSDSNTKK